jgi:cell division septum initiation protein DivIVA
MTDRLEKTVKELLEEIKRLTERIEALEKMVKFHEAIRRR